MEFTILNQLMNLVRGNLREDTSKSPHTGGTGSKTHGGTYSRHGAPRNSIRGVAELGHSAGAYARMDEDGIARGSIQLRNLKAGDVLKTTTTEVRVDRIEKIDEESSSSSMSSPNKARSSESSSEVYIIEHHGKTAI
jgi:hypothetical protein